MSNEPFDSSSNNPHNGSQHKLPIGAAISIVVNRNITFVNHSPRTFYNVSEGFFSESLHVSCSNGFILLPKFISNDPYGILLSWNTSTHFCNWHGITCNPMLQRGSISPHVGNLSYMKKFNLKPKRMGQLSQLQKLVASHNSLEGKIPTNFTGCTCLKGLYLNGNNLIGKVSVKVGSLGKLQHLINFEGDLPQEICHLKSLTKIALDVNVLTGTFPSCLYNTSSLTVISAAANQFNGPLSPNMFHTLPNLQEIYIADNQVSGPIPPSITNAFILSRLEISINYFTGQVPSLGKLQNLLYLTLEKNNLVNCFRKLCQKLQYLNLSKNHLTGAIPLENQLSGDIPGTIRECRMLEYLYMQGNSLQGIIPSSLASLKCLKCLDLSQNCLFGSIPTILQNISFLEYFNVTFNILDGEVPIEGVFGNASRLVVIGNSKLCGGISELHLPPCPVKGKKLAKFRVWNFSSVCKGTLELEDKVFAIKALNLQRKGAHKSFIVECNALKNIKHRNLVQILTCCSSTDFKEQWLHPMTLSAEHSRKFSLDQRLNIMIDQSIIHCDLKSCNVLLDDDMTAHVSNFGIARLISIINAYHF
ncbi:hypothetical protein AAZX31_01G142000 [Glycine max]